MTSAASQISAAPLLASERPSAEAAALSLATSQHLNSYVRNAVLVAGLGSLLFGVDTGIISSVLGSIESDLGGNPLSSGDQELIVSATTLGALLSSCLAAPLADRLGRKPVIVLAALLFILGALEQSASQVLKELVLGRIIVGLAVGLASMVLPTFVAEVAPKEVRGQLVTLLIVLVTGGQVLAYLIGFAFFNLAHGWRWMLLASGVPAVAQLLLSIKLPESPRFLIRKDRLNDARLVLSRIYPGSSAQSIESRISDIQLALDSEDEAAMPLKLDYGFLEAWKDRLWTDLPTRRALVVACGLQFFQQATGFNSLMYFSVTILQRAGFSQPSGFACLVAVANFAGTLAALKIIDQTGRRKILLMGTGAMTAALALLALFFIFVDFDSGAKANTWSYLSLVAMVCFTCCYAISIGNVPWLMQAELFSYGVRAVAGAIATATCWLSNLLVSATCESVLHLVSAISPSGVFGLYCVSSASACLFTWALVPETRGLTIEQCRALFEFDSVLIPLQLKQPSRRSADEERQALFEADIDVEAEV